MPAEINGLAGYPDGYKVTIIPGLHRMDLPTAEDLISVASTEAGELLVVPSKYVTLEV